MPLNIERWIPEPLTDIDDRLSNRVRSTIGAAQGQCYRNSCRALTRLAEPELIDARYVEGYAVNVYGEVIAHAWLQIGDEVVEPTLPMGFRAYFPGLKYTRGAVIRLLGRRNVLPLLHQQRGGPNHPAILGAFIAAREYAGLASGAERRRLREAFADFNKVDLW